MASLYPLPGNMPAGFGMGALVAGLVAVLMNFESRSASRPPSENHLRYFPSNNIAFPSKVL